MIDVLVSDNPLVWSERDGARRFALAVGEAETLADLVREAVFRAGFRGAAWKDPLVIVDGTHYSAEALAASRGAGVRQVRVTVGSGEPATIVGLVASVILSLAAAALAPGLKSPRASGSRERPPGFGRFSSPAVTGECIPVVLGKALRYGGKVVSMVPGEGEGGDARLKVLVCFGHGPVNAIGSFTASTDGTSDGQAVAGVTGIYLQDREISEFPTAKVSVRLGEDGQRPIPGFDDDEVLQSVGVAGLVLRNTDGVERTGGSPSAEAVLYEGVTEVDALTIRVRFPEGLYHIGSGSTPDSRTVKWRYRIRKSDVGGGTPGTWSPWRVVTVTQASTTPLFSARLHDLVAGVWFPQRHDVQVERVSVEPDAGSLTDRDEMWFDSVIERRNAENDYAGMAVLALDLVAGENLTSVPEVSADVEGFALCRVWDGVSALDDPAFEEAYSGNPAAHAFTYMTNGVWGMGMADGELDLESVARAMVLCDGEVARPASSGGGTRKKFVQGVVVDAAKADVEWPEQFLQVARGQLVSSGNKWRFVHDVAQDAPVEVYGDDDIVADENELPRLTIGYKAVTGGLTEPNQLTAQFASADVDGRTASVTWPQPGELWLATETLRAESQRLDGVSDPDQAMADVVYRMKRIRGARRTCSLTTARDLPAVQPGDRFDLVAPDLGFGLASGVLAPASTAGAPVLDVDLLLDTGVEYEITITTAEGAIEVRSLADKDGSYPAGSALSVSTPFDEDVTTGPVRYAVARRSTRLLPFICTSIRQVEGPEGALHWQVDGVEYVAASHDPELVDVPRPVLGEPLTHARPPGPMLTLTATEVVRSGDGVAVVRLAWTQTPADRAATAGVRTYRRALGTDAWVLLPTLTAGSVALEIPVADLGLPYEFVVVAVTATGVGLSPYDPRHPVASVAVGTAAPAPGAPTGVVITQLTGNRYRLSWDAVDGAAAYQVLGHTVSTALPNAGAENAAVVDRVSVTHLDLVLPTGLSSRFWVRSVGATGRLSHTAGTAVEATPAAPVGQTVRTTSSWDLSTDGTLTNLTWTSGRLRLTDPTLPGVWESPEIDMSTAAACELVALLQCVNDAEDPALEDVLFGVPSIEADQWGIVSGSGGTAVVGMLMPPWTADDGDAAQTYAVEVKAHNGTTWGPYAALEHFAVRAGMMEKARVRVTVNRGDDASPYRPALVDAKVVVTY